MTYNPAKHLLLEKVPKLYIDSGFTQLDIMELDTGSIVGDARQTLPWFTVQVNAWLREMGEEEFQVTERDVVTVKAFFYYDPFDGGPEEWQMNLKKDVVPEKFMFSVHYINL